MVQEQPETQETGVGAVVETKEQGEQIRMESADVEVQVDLVR